MVSSFYRFRERINCQAMNIFVKDHVILVEASSIITNGLTEVLFGEDVFAMVGEAKHY